MLAEGGLEAGGLVRNQNEAAIIGSVSLYFWLVEISFSFLFFRFCTVRWLRRAMRFVGQEVGRRWRRHGLAAAAVAS